MKNGLATAMLVACGWVGTAQATVQTYEFTATMQDIGSVKELKWSDQGEGKTAGTVVRRGDVVTGRFSFDDAMAFVPFDPSADPHSSAAGWYLYSSYPLKLVSLEYTIASIGLNYVSDGGNVSVENDNFWDGDIFRVSTYMGSNVDPTQTGTIGLFNSAGTLFTNGLIPQALSLNDYNGALLSAEWYRGSDGGYMMTSSVITSLTQAGAVPEPASAALFIAGLAAAGMGMRRKARRVTCAA